MKFRFLHWVAFSSAIMTQGCDTSGIGCSHNYSFIPTTTVNSHPLSLSRVTVSAKQPAVVDTWSYLTAGHIFTLSIDIKNISTQIQNVSEFTTISADGVVVPTQINVQWTSKCQSTTCTDLESTSDAPYMLLSPQQSGRIDVEIKLKDVEEINELSHNLSLISDSDDKPYSITWSMTRIERRINCIHGTGHPYRLVTDL